MPMICFEKTFYCLSKGNNEYEVTKPVWSQEKRYLQKVGTITPADIQLLRKYASSVESEKIFVTGKYDLPDKKTRQQLGRKFGHTFYY